jgi:hypothetical protein
MEDIEVSLTVTPPSVVATYNLHMSFDSGRPYTYSNWRAIVNGEGTLMDSKILTHLVRGNFIGFVNRLLGLSEEFDPDTITWKTVRNNVRPFGSLPRKTT